MSLPTIDATRARALVEKGAVLVDIREADERAREHVPGARHNPLSRLSPVDAPPGGVVIFHCRSGARTAANAARLADAAACDAYILEGGMDAWKRAGLPVAARKGQPIEIMRQVQITAGSLVLLGVILGFTVSPAWFGLSGFIGAGLTFAGISGWCGMARMLALMPWNRAAARAMGA